MNSAAAETRQVDLRLQKTFDYAMDVTRQLLTLGTAVLALTLTLGKDVPTGRQGFLLTAWAAFLVSVISGIFTLYALMTEFAPSRRDQDAIPSIGSWRVRGPSLLMVTAFALGTTFLVLYGYSVFKPGSLG